MESLLVSSILKSTLVLIVAFGVTALMRHASAAARHAVWSAALVGVIAVPLVSNAIPWQVGVLPSGWGSAVVEEETLSSPADWTSTPQTLVPSTAEAELDGGPAGSAPISGGIQPGPETFEPGPPADGGLISVVTRDPWRFALFVWLAVAALILARILIGMAWMWRVARRAEPLSGPSWLLPLGRVTEQLGLRTAVRIVRSGAAPMPVTCGVLRPAIVLPEESEAWTEERKEAVLLHELAHVRRGDLATHLIAWIACSLYWFHPLAWMAARRLRHESERACDDLVLGAGTRASEYASHLLDIVRSAGRESAPAATVPMAQKSSFEGRLLAILQPGVARQALTGRKKVAVAAGLTLVLLPLAAMAPAKPGSPSAGFVPGLEPGGNSADPIALEEPSAWPADPKAHEAAGTDVVADVDVLDGMGPIKYAESFQFAQSQSQSQSQNESQAQSEANGRKVAALAVALRDADAEVRASAAQALGSLGDPRAVEALLQALRSDADAGVRKMAAWALGEIESPAAVGGLSQALRSDSSAEVRASAAWALGEIESAEAVEALGAALRDSSVEVRRNAVWALGQIESAEAVEWLIPALQDADVEIRRKATWALGEIESPAAVPGLSAAMRDSDVEVRGTAAWALGEIQSPAGIDALRVGMTDSDVEVRRKSAWAMGEIQDARAVPALTAALDDADHETRKTAVWALGEIQDVSAIPALRPLLHDPDGEVRKTAIWALLEMDDPAVYDVLVELLQDEDPEVRKQAAQALGNM
jgi:HEAT repeat protein/beta-lactamase regulating signal transducer with metallopeptidase domain